MPASVGQSGGLRACHYADEFTLRRIHPLGRQEKLVYECSWFADPSHELADGKILTSLLPILSCYDNLTILCSFNHRRGVTAHVIHV
jgi:hypothetical protein